MVRIPIFSHFGYFYRDRAPQWMWDHLRNGSRKGKDVTAPLMRLLNKTKLYDFCLKSTAGWGTFVAVGGVLFAGVGSEILDSVWDRVNRGKLYKDVPYVYPIEDDDE